MGHKVHPTAFRLPLNMAWQSKWFASKNYATLLHNDLEMRRFIEKKYKNTGISAVLIHRGLNEVNVTVQTAKPGLLIGRSGAGATDLKNALEKITGGRVRLTIEEIKKADLRAPLVAASIANQIERRVSFRRAMRQAVEKALAAGAEGIKVMVSGRLNGAEIARSEKLVQGTVTLGTLRNYIDYAYVPAMTTYGVIGVKVWIYLGVSDVTAQEN